MDKRITSQDVADLAGVSRTTVSFVLNDVQRFSISAETRERVKQAAQELGYVPNASAQRLASNQAKAIGLIMTRDPSYIVSDTFLPQILGGLLDVVKSYQLSLMTEWVEPGQQMRTYLELTRSKHIDGMILMTPRYDDPGLQAIAEAKIPAVLMGAVPGSELYSVDVDNTAAAGKAVQHLLDLGHQRVACITNAPSPYSSSAQRLDGYRAALTKAGIAYDEALVRFADFDVASGYEQMRDLLASGQQFSAAFIASDNVAFGALRAIQEAGLRIPEDISLVGFDDIPLAAYTNPPLTTIHMPANEIAQQSCHLLMRLMRGKTPECRSITLSTDLIVRRSTQPKEGAR